MAGKLNHQAVNQYAEQFSQAVCDDFFDAHTSAEGKDLGDISPIKQVNLLVIKSIFEKWQDEYEKLKSPYFDYSTTEVNQALRSFMNVVSHHIRIKRTYLEPLISESTADSLRLLLSPYLFFEKEVQKLGAEFHIEKQFKPMLRYVKTHRILAQKIVEVLEAKAENGIIQTQEALESIAEAIDNNLEYDDPKYALKSFNQVVQIRMQDLAISEEEQKGVVQEETPEANTTSDSTQEIPASAVLQVQEIKAPEPEPVETLVDDQPKEALKSLRTIIPVNMKFVFIKELFKDDSIEYEQAIDAIDATRSYSEAMGVIKQNYLRKYGWGFDNDSVKEFYEMVGRRF